MIVTIAPTETDIFTATRSVLLTMGLAPAVASQNVDIIRGQVNRVPEPLSGDFVVIWPLMRERLAMNIDDYLDGQFAGSITANTLTVTALDTGAPAYGQLLYGDGIAAGCTILTQLSGPAGGVGTYQVSPTPDAAAQTIYCGTKSVLQKTEITLQADIHGPASADNAHRIQSLFRDQFGVDAFQAANPMIAPLYTSSPRQIPFFNAEQQTEERWTMDLCMQAEVTLIVTQQFAAALHSDTTPVYTLAS